MTKYILHGGAAKKETEDNRKFFIEITKGLPDPVSLLIVCFAKKKDIWDEVFENVKLTFSWALPEKQIEFVLASENTETFIEQIKKANALYMLGGETRVLRDYLAKVDNLEELWSGKVIAGSSAGALALAKYWYENDDDTYNKGLGIFPFKLFCHYTEKKSGKLNGLKEYGDDSEVKTIEEEKYFIIEK